MSIVNFDGTAADVERADPAEYFRQLADTYCGDNPRHLRYLSQFCLRELLGWTFEQIGNAYGQHRGRVQRNCEVARRGLRWASRFAGSCPHAGPCGPDSGAGETAAPPPQQGRAAA